MAAEHAAHLWSFLDELAESDPEAYRRFIRKQTEEFRNISSRAKEEGGDKSGNGGESGHLDIPTDWLEKPTKRKPLIEEVDEFVLVPNTKHPGWIETYQVVQQEETDLVVVQIEFAYGYGQSMADIDVTMVGEDKLEVSVKGNDPYLIDLEARVNVEKVGARLNPRRGQLKVHLNRI